MLDGIVREVLIIEAGDRESKQGIFSSHGKEYVMGLRQRQLEERDSGAVDLHLRFFSQEFNFNSGHDHFILLNFVEDLSLQM